MLGLTETPFRLQKTTNSKQFFLESLSHHHLKLSYFDQSRPSQQERKKIENAKDQRKRKREEKKTMTEENANKRTNFET